MSGRVTLGGCGESKVNSMFATTDQVRSNRAAVRHARSGGFTLVEMMVATGLVVLIMSLFAQIFGTAVGTISEQRGMANNDQKARIVSELLRNDLRFMTYKQSGRLGMAAGIVPFVPGDDPAVWDFEAQKGYFYLSENDPEDGSDDVLQFTVELKGRNADDFFYGKAAGLEDAGQNQPVNDGGSTVSPGKSRCAEVSYFLRHGTLYRRVLLLRDPPEQNPAWTEQPVDNGMGEPLYGDGNENYVPAGQSFWSVFDYSASRFYPASGNSHLWFNGKSSLDNSGATSPPTSIALPWYRFGHLNSVGNTNHGQPVEFARIRTAAGHSQYFFGRFTQAETSSPAMQYPGVEGGWGNSLPNRSNVDSGDSEIDDEGNFKAFKVNDKLGDRFGEDVLLTNVEAFDVEVWDPELKIFVQLGRKETTADIDSGNVSAFGDHSGAFTNPAYGPKNADNVIFDTWHPNAEVGGDTDPPMLPLLQSDPQPWAATTYSVGASVSIPSVPSGSWVYKVISGSGTSVDDPNDGTPELNEIVVDNGITWQCVDNRVGLRAIRVTVRYLDPQTQMPRQVTVLHSFAK